MSHRRGAEAAPATATDGPVQPAAEKIDGPPVQAGNGAENATPVAARIASAHGVDIES